MRGLAAEGLERFVSNQANRLIRRHFTLGAQVLGFIGRNARGTVEASPLTPVPLDELKDDLFLKHGLNLFNFVRRLNQHLRDQNLTPGRVEHPDFSMIKPPEAGLEDMPRGRFNLVALQPVIECFTPVHPLLLTDNDF
jgi:hypothetical protein